jgi:two-component SAPR family response regulator
LTPTDNSLAGRQILIVEDELIIAWEVSNLVESLGCLVCGPVPSVEAALAMLRQAKPDAALLDVNLQGQRVTPVAQECQRQSIPFALVTAYARFRLDEPLLDNAERVHKPFNQNDIREVLTALTGRVPQ